jgi:hypothetical protein
MPPPSRRSRANLADRRRRARAARLRRVVGATIIGAGLLVTLLATAFGSGSTGALRTTGPQTLLPTGPPLKKVIAAHGPEDSQLRLYLPISESRKTAIAYHASGDGALALDPIGRQANEGVFTRAAHRIFGGGSSGLSYYLVGGGSGPSTSALDVGAAAGTDVYSPVEGTVVGLSPFVLNGKKFGSRIEIQPTDLPTVVVALTQLRADPALKVGSTVSFSRTKVGTVVDLSGVQRQALARYTQDAGNHVTVQVFTAATLTLH